MPFSAAAKHSAQAAAPAAASAAVNSYQDAVQRAIEAMLARAKSATFDAAAEPAKTVIGKIKVNATAADTFRIAANIKFTIGADPAKRTGRFAFQSGTRALYARPGEPLEQLQAQLGARARSIKMAAAPILKVDHPPGHFPVAARILALLRELGFWEIHDALVAEWRMRQESTKAPAGIL